MNTLLGYSYKNGGQVSNKLKPIPEGNPGLAKLSQEIRNRMGYMQEGGSVSSRLAALLRKKEKYNSQQSYEKALREEAKNKQKASLFGGLGSLAGSLLLPALTGITGGAALPLIVALGAAGGKKIGASSGYQGKLDLNPFNAADYSDYSNIMDDEDLIYGKDAFEGLESSARDYTRSGMEQDAIVSGLKSGLMAGFGGSDSMYSKAGSVNLLKEGAGQRFKDLFKQQAIDKLLKPNSMVTSDRLAARELLTDTVPTSYVSSMGSSPSLINQYTNLGLQANRPNTFSSQLGGVNQTLFDNYRNPTNYNESPGLFSFLNNQ
tara:strand:+ start:212 stop:1168 length:957 start_codon:yes stop_codon:yes gene_type:complete